jgi:DNA-binding XRE family transcriptional regulator
MPNIGTLLKQEISRLSRREVRTHVKATKNATAQHRRHIAALKRQVTKLDRQVSLLEHRVLSAPPVAPVNSNTKRVRFVAKGLRWQRERLGLSAADYGRLVGVSAQSIYNWERGRASPRREQLMRLAAFRVISKREAQARLQQLGAKDAKTRRKP